MDIRRPDERDRITAVTRMTATAHTSEPEPILHIPPDTSCPTNLLPTRIQVPLVRDCDSPTGFDNLSNDFVQNHRLRASGADPAAGDEM